MIKLMKKESIIPWYCRDFWYSGSSVENACTDLLLEYRNFHLKVVGSSLDSGEPPYFRQNLHPPELEGLPVNGEERVYDALDSG